MKVAIQLKTCPFCGCDVEMSHGVMNLPIYLFKCKNHNCGAVMSSDNDRTRVSAITAVDFYNKRNQGGN